MRLYLALLLLISPAVNTCPLILNFPVQPTPIEAEIAPVRPSVNLNDRSLLSLTHNLGFATDIIVLAGGDFQAAMNAAQPGDTIVLQAGARYKAPVHQAFVVPAKANITVRSSAIAELPSGRVSPADKSKMAAIVATGPQGALTSAPGAIGWKFDGIEFTNESDGSQAQFCHTLIGFSGPQGGTLHPSNFGNNITFTRSYIHPQEDGTTNYLRTAAHAIIWNAGSVTIAHNYISGFVGVYAHSPNEKIDTVAIGSSAAGGPFHVHDNYINADFNPIFLGGGENGSPNVATVAAGATLTNATLSQVANLQVGDKIAIEVGAVGGDQYACGTVQSINGTSITYTKLVRNEGGEQYVDSTRAPTTGGKAKWRGFTIHDFTFTRNTVDTDLVASQWVLERTGAKPKAYAEIKLLERGLIEGNIFQGFPTGFVITLRNQNGFSPWSNVKDVIIRNNLFDDFSAHIVQLFSGDRLSETGSNIQFVNNLMKRPISSKVAGTFPVVIYTAFGSGILVQHNTVLNIQDQSGGMMMIGLVATQGAVVKDNIMYFNRYGVQCSAAGNTFQDCWPGFQEQGNVIVNNDNDCAYVNGANGNFPNSFCADASFTLTSDYRLPANSPYKGRGSDGKDPGVDMDVLLAAIGGTLPIPTPSPSISPSPSPLPTPTQSPTPTPTPSPTGSRDVDGYLKVNGDYFQATAIVTITHPSMVTQTFQTSPGGYFMFRSAVLGSILLASGSGYSFGPITVDDSPYFVLNGVSTIITTPTPTPLPTPSVSPTPSPSPTPNPPCVMDVPLSISVPQNGIGQIGVSLNSMTWQPVPLTITAVSSTPGQVSVSPIEQNVVGTSAVALFSVKVKRKSATVTFTSPCGTGATVVRIQ